MYCTKCGERNADTYTCRRCGAALKGKDGVSEECSAQAGIPAGSGQKRRGKRLFVILPTALAAVLLVALVLTPAALAWHQPEGFAVTVPDGKFLSPENSIEFFVTAVTEMNMDAALSACAINEYAEQYDAQAVFEDMHMIGSYMAAPNQYDLYQAMNQASILGTVATQLRYFIYGFTDSEAVLSIISGNSYPLQDDPEREAREFIESVDPSFIRNLTIISIDLPEPEMFDSEDNLSYNERIAGYYGADEMTERVALYELDDVYYYSGFQLARYGETWKIVSLISILGDCPAIGAAQQITREEYDELVS
jgi:hypothetical protein